MPAFATHVIHALQNKLGQLRIKYRNEIELNFTHRELASMFVNPEHIETVFQAADLAQLSDSDSISFWHSVDKGPTCRVYMCMRRYAGKHGFMMPAYAEFPIYASEAMTKRLGEHIDMHCKVENQFIRMATLLNVLNQNCTTPAQLRYFWPPIVGLLDSTLGYGEVADIYKIRDLKIPTKKPSFSVPFLNALRETLEPLAVAMMIPDEPKPVSDNPVQVTISVAEIAPPAQEDITNPIMEAARETANFAFMDVDSIQPEDDE